MKLSKLLEQSLDKDIEVTKMVDDTRELQAGDVFVFDKRIHADAERFIEEAKVKGAGAVISNIKMDGVIFNANPGKVMAKWAVTVYSRQPANIAAITGTNGKTSVAWFFMQLMSAIGESAASVGTLGFYSNMKKLGETGYTSPTAVKTHEILDGLVEDGVTHVCVETSSHALDLNRMDEVKFKAAGLTNITQDHLDFHGNMEAYSAAKQRLFIELLEEGGTAVLPVQRKEGMAFAAACKQIFKQKGINVLTVGSANAELIINSIESRADGQVLDFKYGSARREVFLPLVGDFQAENLAVAVGLVIALGTELEPVMANLSKLKSVPGRMEIIAGPKENSEQHHKNRLTVIVDYAHTPDALERVLQALRPLVVGGGKLWVVFGAGGDRDIIKRPLMGKVAASLADVSVVTDDNPRTEDADSIRAMVCQGVENEKSIGNREEAIAYAINNAGVDDIVVLAGKGHETGQIIGREIISFNDRDVAKKFL